MSARKNKLPKCPKEVSRQLTDTYGIDIKGLGLRSAQQKALKLLECLDPTLTTSMGEKKLQTGDYQWADKLMPDLIATVKAHVTLWIPTLPPLPYDDKNPEDVALWNHRKKSEVAWLGSLAAAKFAKQVYCAYASNFSDCVKDT